MIEFRGELSKECKEFMMKSVRKAEHIISIILAIIWLIPGIALGWFLQMPIIYPLWMIVVVIIALAPIIGKNKGDGTFPEKVYVENGKITAESEHFYSEVSLDDVYKVVDYGEWYHVLFLEEMDKRFVCQKDLIKQGTLEEFEALFEDKLFESESIKARQV